MVVMAVLTTVMAGPLLGWIYPPRLVEFDQVPVSVSSADGGGSRP
jgi:hypothetical protein